MQPVSRVLCTRCPALLMTVVILLRYQIQAQSLKHRAASKPAPPQRTPEPALPKPELSKEFMLLGRCPDKEAKCGA